MIDRRANVEYRSAPEGRLACVRTFGELAVDKVQRIVPRLDSLDDAKLIQLRGQTFFQLARYAEGSLKGRDDRDSSNRQSALNMVSCEVGEILDSRGVDVKEVVIAGVRQKPILERVSFGEIDRMGSALAGRMRVLGTLVQSKNMGKKDQNFIRSRANMLGERLRTLGFAYSERIPKQ